MRLGGDHVRQCEQAGQFNTMVVALGDLRPVEERERDSIALKMSSHTYTHVRPHTTNWRVICWSGQVKNLLQFPEWLNAKEWGRLHANGRTLFQICSGRRLRDSEPPQAPLNTSPFHWSDTQSRFSCSNWLNVWKFLQQISSLCIRKGGEQQRP